MAISKFDTPAQLAPIDFGFLAQQQAYHDQKDLANLKLYSDIAQNLPIKGGYATQQLAQDYNQKVLSPMAEKYADRIAKNESPATWYRDYIKDVNRVKTDPVYNRIKEDESYTEQVQKQMLEPDFNYTLQDYFDPQKGFYQVSAQDIQSGWTPGYHYKGEKPMDINTDFKDYYSQIKSELSKDFSDPVKSFEYDAEGNPIAVVETVYGLQKEYIDPNRVREIITPMVMNNFPALIGSKQSLRYNAKYYNRLNPNFQYDQLSAIDDITSGFLGSFERELEMQPRVSKTMIPKKGVKDGEGSDKDQPQLLDNPVDITIMSAQQSPTGTANADLRTASVLLNGSQPNEQDGTFQLNLAGSPTLLTVGESGSPQEIHDNAIKINAYGRLKDLKNSYEDKFSSEASAIREYENMENNLKKTYNPDQGYIVKKKWGTWMPGDIITPISGLRFEGFDIYKKDATGGSTLVESMDRDQAMMMSLDEQPEFKAVQKQFMDKYNIDISDPAFKTEVASLAKDEDQEMISTISTALENYSGNVKFTPNRSESVFRGNDGNFYVRGVTEISAADLKGMFGDKKKEKIEKAEELGIIVPKQVGTGKKGGEQEVVSYVVPIVKQVYEDLPGATQRYWSGPGTQEFEKKQALGQTERSKQVFTQIKSMQAANRVIKPAIEKDPQGFQDALISRVNLLEGTPQEKATAIQGIQNLINAARSARASGDNASLTKIYASLYELYSGLMQGAAPIGTRVGTSTMGAKAYQQGR